MNAEQEINKHVEHIEAFKQLLTDAAMEVSREAQGVAFLNDVEIPFPLKEVYLTNFLARDTASVSPEMQEALFNTALSMVPLTPTSTAADDGAPDSVHPVVVLKSKFGWPPADRLKEVHGDQAEVFKHVLDHERWYKPRAKVLHGRKELVVRAACEGQEALGEVRPELAAHIYIAALDLEEFAWADRIARNFDIDVSVPAKDFLVQALQRGRIELGATLAAHVNLDLDAALTEAAVKLEVDGVASGCGEQIRTTLHLYREGGIDAVRNAYSPLQTVAVEETEVPNLAGLLVLRYQDTDYIRSHDIMNGGQHGDVYARFLADVHSRGAMGYVQGRGGALYCIDTTAKTLVLFGKSEVFGCCDKEAVAELIRETNPRLRDYALATAIPSGHGARERIA